jgi:diguanylate cyclase (GGDEF)-like protein
LRWIAWPTAIGVLVLLASIRVTSKADFAVTSLALIPVLLVTWVIGRSQGLLVAVLATATWFCADVFADVSDLGSWVPWANAAVRLATYSLLAVLAAKVSQLLEWERESATRDELTGLANRRNFLRAGEFEVQRSRRYAHPVAIVFLDLDQFKGLNDSQGHAAGDAALRTTAQALLGVARTTDCVARLGGDEFAVLLPEVDREAARDAATRMSAAVDGALESAFPGVSASVGVAWFGNPAPPIAEMIKTADSLMYESKRHRRRTGDVWVASW